MSPIAILTRPEGRNDALSMNLRNAGMDVLPLPALRLSPRYASLLELPLPHDFDLVVFVSGYAVHTYINQLKCVAGLTTWPLHVAMATVGPASARALAAFPEFCVNTTVLCPDSQAPTYDSEALWEILSAREALPGRVLIVRGTEGRNWLSDRLIDKGVHVVRYAAYERSPVEWSSDTVAELRTLASQGRTATWLLTSGEGIDSVLSNIVRADLMEWWQQSYFIITHPTLRNRLNLGGDPFVMDATVKICLPADESILTAFVAV